MARYPWPTLSEKLRLETTALRFRPDNVTGCPLYQPLSLKGLKAKTLTLHLNCLVFFLPPLPNTLTKDVDTLYIHSCTLAIRGLSSTQRTETWRQWLHCGGLGLTPDASPEHSIESLLAGRLGGW